MESSLKVLKSIGETICGALNEQECIELKDHASKIDSQSPEIGLDTFAKYSLGSLPNIENEMMDMFKRNLPAAKLDQINVVLWLLSTSFGTSILCGYGFKKFDSFYNLDKEDRELALSGWATSRLPQLRMLLKVMVANSVLQAYGDNISADPSTPSNPLWDAVRYPGGVPEKARPASDSFWKPSFLNETLFSNVSRVQVEYDVVVIGSGAGGGLVASELSQSGHSVLLLDKADYTHPSDYPLTEKSSFELFFERSGFLSTDDGGMQILAGTCWGGGTTINWSASLELPAITRKEWAQKHGLTYFDTPAYQKAINVVKNRTGMYCDSISHNGPNQIMIDGCKKLGLKVEDIPQNTAGNTHSCGWCTFGCPYGEKQSSLITWIKDASDAGCHFVKHAAASEIIHENGKIIGVDVRVNENEQRLFVKAKRVVVSCGSINSPALLLRSKISNANIGQNLRLHPVTMIHGLFPDQKINPYAGSIMTAICNKHTDMDSEGYGCRIEAPAMHAAMFSLGNLWTTNALDHKKKTIEMSNTATMIVLTRDKDSVGRISLDKNGNALVEWSLGKNDADSMTTTIITSCEILLAAGAQRVSTLQGGSVVFERTSDSIEETLNSPEYLSFVEQVRKASLVQTKSLIFSAHQMGSCKMGVDRKTSVVQPTGESWQVKGLYVADASVFPTASGVK